MSVVTATHLLQILYFFYSSFDSLYTNFGFVLYKAHTLNVKKKAMLDVAKALREAKLKTSVLLQVHDELILERPEDEAEQSASLVKKVMEEAYKLSMLPRTSISTAKNWELL